MVGKRETKKEEEETKPTEEEEMPDDFMPLF